MREKLLSFGVYSMRSSGCVSAASWAIMALPSSLVTMQHFMDVLRVVFVMGFLYGLWCVSFVLDAVMGG